MNRVILKFNISKGEHHPDGGVIVKIPAGAKLLRIGRDGNSPQSPVGASGCAWYFVPLPAREYQAFVFLTLGTGEWFSAAEGEYLGSWEERNDFGWFIWHVLARPHV